MSEKNARLGRHRFEPGRLVLGLALLAVAAVHLMHATGHGDVPLPVLIVLLPAGLLLTAGVAVVTYLVRQARARRRG